MHARRRRSTHPQASVARLVVAADEVTAAVIGPLYSPRPAGAAIVVVIVVIADSAVVATDIFYSSLLRLQRSPRSAQRLLLPSRSLRHSRWRHIRSRQQSSSSLQDSRLSRQRWPAVPRVGTPNLTRARRPPVSPVSRLRRFVPASLLVSDRRISVHGGPSFPSPSVLSMR